MTFTKRTDAPLCLNVLPDALIAHDLKGTIEKARPDLQVLWAATDDDALKLITNDAPVAVAFVALAPDAFANTPLSVRIARSDAMIVYLDHEANMDQPQGQAPRVRSLRFPFVIEDVLDLLCKAKPPRIEGGGL